MGFAMYTPILCVPPIMHIIRKELFLSHAQVGLVFAAPLITLAVFAIPSGALADKIGTRKAAGGGIIVLTVGSLLRSTSESFITLLAFSFLLGVGYCLIYPNLPKLISSWCPSERIGFATGVYSSGITIGCALPLAITLTLIYPITDTWEGVFYLWTIPAILAAIVWWIVVKDRSRSKVEDKGKSAGKGSSYKVWSNRSLWLAAILLFVNSFAMYTWTGWTPLLMMAKGATPDLAALITSVIIWACLPVVLVVPWASDKIGLRKPFLGASFVLLALASFSAIYIDLSLGWAFAVAVGIALGAQYGIVLTLPAELGPTEGVGRATGMMLSIAYTGGLAGPWMAGHIIDVTGTLSPHLIVLGGLAGVGVFLVFRLPETGPRVRSHQLG
jgi:CP family cyanate transporter-like MFS transporter